MNYYIAVLKKYATFTGRARRKEYWMFTLVNVIISLALQFLGAAMNLEGVLDTIYSLATLLPAIAVGVRRMHDVNRSGWYLLIPIYNLILACTEGTQGDNEYGADPKAVEVIE